MQHFSFLGSPQHQKKHPHQSTQNRIWLHASFANFYLLWQTHEDRMRLKILDLSNASGHIYIEEGFRHLLDSQNSQELVGFFLARNKKNRDIWWYKYGYLRGKSPPFFSSKTFTSRIEQNYTQIAQPRKCRNPIDPK